MSAVLQARLCCHPMALSSGQSAAPCRSSLLYATIAELAEGITDARWSTGGRRDVLPALGTDTGFCAEWLQRVRANRWLRQSEECRSWSYWPVSCSRSIASPPPLTQARNVNGR